MGNFDFESRLDLYRLEAMSIFKEYVGKNCNEKGKQRCNLNRSQQAGLKSLKKRKKDGEIVVTPIDKTGNLAVFSRESYEKTGNEHTKGDTEVGWERIKESQSEVNGHVAMIIKMFKLGKN